MTGFDMGDRHTIHAHLQSISQGGLSLDEDGQCILQDDSGLVFRIEVPQASDRVFWIANLGRYTPGGADSALLEELMRLNHLGLETKGAQFSLASDEPQVVLWLSQELRLVTEEVFERVTLNFADLAIHWTAKLEALRLTSAGSGAGQGVDQAGKQGETWLRI
ncbi:type III secretion system chaperone [Anianabacter salinae]|uniref:type III secretion system chaperone n=1 Tax=Anianabacter salinae TaxID=2851023 RepID=UPI00225E18A6|nr:type III secretion system chaperone [Anianabacter salinae]MBV0913420.1 type III secretion system chaperone [Anianabacter salinae]